MTIVIFKNDISPTVARNFCESGEYIVAMHFVTTGVHASMMRKYLKDRFMKLSIEQKFMHDLDLAILGDTKNHGAYTLNIRCEFLFIHQNIYAEKRIAVLQKFLGQKDHTKKRLPFR